MTQLNFHTLIASVTLASPGRKFCLGVSLSDELVDVLDELRLDALPADSVLTPNPILGGVLLEMVSVKHS